MAIKNQDQCCLLSNKIIEVTGNNNFFSSRSATLYISLGLPSLLEIPLEDEARIILKNKMLEWINIRALLTLLIVWIYQGKITKDSAYFLYRRFMFTLKSLKPTLSKQLELHFYRYMFIMPAISHKILCVLFKRLRKIDLRIINDQT